jgi:circadian clock protein KaiC
MSEGSTTGRKSGQSAPFQVPTGIPGLDRLLNGGLRYGGLHVVLGGPGMGKSVLAHQIGGELIRAGGKVLYLTSLVETHQTLIAQARTFRFFDAATVPDLFYYASLYPVLARGGLQAVRDEMSRLVAHHDPSLVVIDGIHALKAAAEDRLDYQRFMHELEAQAAVAGMTTLMLAHPPDTAIAADPTFTIADAIFHMRTRTVRLREVRMFSVGKLRGVAHIAGWHTFDITSNGISVYPRVESLAAGMGAHVAHVAPDDAASEETLRTGIEGLDEMLGGGLPDNSTTLIVGAPGSGKTLSGLAFLSAGAEADEPGLLLGYHERPATLIRKGEAVGLPVRKGIEQGRIHLHWTAPLELLVDREIERLMTMVREHGIKRVVIDALEDLRNAVVPRSRDVVVLATLVNLLREEGVTTILLQDLERIVGVNFDMPMAELSALMDNVYHLRYVEQKGELKRLLSVLKVRARGHDHSLRQFHIGAKGLSVGKAFDRSEMVLTGLGLPR